MILHRAVLIHKCTQCDNAYATEEHLRQHIEEGHVNKPYACTMCNKQFSRGEHLIRHLKTHQNSNEEDLKCAICEKTFTRLVSLTVSEQISHKLNKPSCIDRGN